jgi:hypothetical protein
MNKTIRIYRREKRNPNHSFLSFLFIFPISNITYESWLRQIKNIHMKKK